MSIRHAFLDQPVRSWPANAFRGSFFLGLLPLVLGMAFIWPMSRGTKVQMTPDTSETPAAQGTVNVSSGANNNTKVDIKVKNLAKPSSLRNPKDVYVVWIQPEGQEAKNEGQMRIQEDRTGSLKTETPYKHFEVFITPESNPRAEQPNGPHVLSATVE